jgi:hypothetical protein
MFSSRLVYFLQLFYISYRQVTDQLQTLQINIYENKSYLQLLLRQLQLKTEL